MNAIDPRISFNPDPAPLPDNMRRVAPARLNYVRKNLLLRELREYSAEEIIEMAFEEDPETMVSWSGGKCSTVALHLTLQINPEVKVNFNNTGIEFPETYEFIEYITEEWGIDLVTLRPETTFWACVKDYGYPMIRGKQLKRRRGKDGRPMCCQLLKEKPLLKAGISSTITGLRATESRMRTFALAQRGQYYFAKTLKRWQWHPIGLWTHDQVWDYHRKHDIPHNKIYDMGHHRCGCWPCTGYLYWKTYLSKSHPEMYRALMKIKGEPTLWEYADDEACRQGGIEDPW